jgi:hypothetical protein
MKISMIIKLLGRSIFYLAWNVISIQAIASDSFILTEKNGSKTKSSRDTVGETQLTFSERIERYRLHYSVANWAKKSPELDHLYQEPFRSFWGSPSESGHIPAAFRGESGGAIFIDPSLSVDPRSGASFSDSFRCRDELLRLVTKKIDSFANVKINIVDADKVTALLKKAECDRFLLSGGAQELVPKSENTAEWRPFKFSPSIHFTGPKGKLDLVNDTECKSTGQLKILTNANDKALLIRSALKIDKDSSLNIQLVNYSRPKKLIPFNIESLKVAVPGVSSMHLVTTSHLVLENDENFPQLLNREKALPGPNGGRVVLARIELWADLGKGPIMVALGRPTFVSNHFYVEPELSVTIVDVDSNGYPDFYFKGAYRQAFLVLTYDGQISKMMELNGAEDECGGD